MLTQINEKVVQGRLSLASQVVALGYEHHLRFKVLPPLGILDAPKEINGWTFIPRELDNTPVPPEIDRHGQYLKGAGFVVLQEIIGHEPKEEMEMKPKRDYTKVKEQAAQVAKFLGVLVGLAITAAVGLAYIFALALSADPALIYVLEDGTWLVVGEFYE